MFSLFGCATSSLSLERGSASDSPVVILVPGFKGSLLAPALTAAPRWITVSEALLGRHSLLLNDEYALHPLSVLGEVKLLWGLLRFDGYAGSARNLRQALGSTVEIQPFAYDWRLPVQHTADRLASFVSSFSGRSVYIAAHSLGGLVAAHYIRMHGLRIAAQSSRWPIDGVIFGGVPFRGAMTIFRDIHRGIRTGLNRALLNPTAMASFASSYQLLPHPDDSVVLNVEGNEQLSLYDPALWRALRWVDAGVPLKERLELAESTHRTLDGTGELATKTPLLPCINLRGQGFSSMSRVALALSARRAWFFPWDRPTLPPHPNRPPLMTDGDGIVDFAATELPPLLKRICAWQDVPVKAEHGAIFRTAAAQRAARAVVAPPLTAGGEPMSVENHEYLRIYSK